jgi:cob(I)alamin adenosyltransferase
VLAVPGLPDAVRTTLLDVQHDLFDLGGELCIPGHRIVTATYVERLEQALDAFNDDLPPLKDFILPGGGPAAAAFISRARSHDAQSVGYGRSRAPRALRRKCRST